MHLRATWLSRWGGGWLALAPLLAGCATVRPAPPAPLSLPGVVDSVTSAPPLHRTHWGVAVYDPARRQWLHRLNPERNFVPASNTKLVVSAVSLAELGADYRYRTTIHAPGRAEADTVAEKLVVVGSGDPTLSARFHGSDFAALEMLADSLVRAGIRRVAGDLVIDASRFDAETVHPTWEVGDLPWEYATPVAAFAIAEGTVRVEVRPGAAAGEPATVTALAPAGAIVVQGRVATTPADTPASLDVVRRDTAAIELAGSVPVGAPPDTQTLAVVDPAGFAGRALEAVLEARGIPVAGTVRVVYDPAEAAALRGAAGALVTWTSPPLAEIVAAILKPSQNWIAEQVLKTLGAERAGRGSWPAGLDVERAYLFGTVGIDSSAVFLRDASGLSAQNLMTPRAIVQLLEHARLQPWGEALRAALPRPGEPGSTLAARLRGLEGRVQAKTGTITHVNALSGYALTVDGRELVFTILTNASGRPAREVRGGIDRVVTAIVTEGGRP